MKTVLQCAACIIDDLRGALEDSVEDQEQRFSILAEATEWLGREFHPDGIPSYYITRVHRILKDATGLEMPFQQLRARCNEAGMSVAESITQRIAEVDEDRDRLRFLCMWAIAGNHLDFRTVGTGYDLSPKQIEARLEEVVEEGLIIDHTPALAEAVCRRPEVLYLCDNVGEIALDRLLIEELLHRGCTVTAAVKGGPITSDAVLADAQATGLTQLAPIILTGPDTLGLPLPASAWSARRLGALGITQGTLSWQRGEMSEEIEAALQDADLIIAKGQANYYALSEIHTDLPGQAFCLLRTKCQPVAATLGCPDQSKVGVVVQLSHRPQPVGG